MKDSNEKQVRENGLQSLRYGIPINYRWVVEFILLPVIVAGSMFWMTGIWTRLNEIDVRLRQIDSQVVTNTTNNGNVQETLLRIERKLDESIQREINRSL